MHNPKQDIEECYQLIESGAKYDGHAKHTMTRTDRFLYWFSTIAMYSALIGGIYLIIKFLF